MRSHNVGSPRHLRLLLLRRPLFILVATIVQAHVLQCDAFSLKRQRLVVVGRLDMEDKSISTSGSSNNKDKNFEDQRELLEQLDQTFDYPGRVLSSGTTTTPSSPSSFRSGYVSVIGAPNMGKSTLVNALMGENLCIATRRPQTTRHAILGILQSNDSDSGCQVCLWDTPGILKESAYRLQEGMMEAVQGAWKDADVLLVVTDLFSTPIPNDDLFLRLQQQTQHPQQKPIIVVINKVDLVDKVSTSNHNNNNHQPTTTSPRKTVTVPEAVAQWRQWLPHARIVLPVSAAEGSTNPGVVALRKLLLGGPDLPAALRNLGRPIPGMFPTTITTSSTITDHQAKALLPLGPPLYDPELLTDRSERFLASEMIRAALLETFRKELPYCCEVQVTSFKDDFNNNNNENDNNNDNIDNTKTTTKQQQHQKKKTKLMIRMEATIFVERESQKRIVIGTQGSKIKQVGILARQSLQDFFQSPIFLQLQVKVDQDWRKKDEKLKKYGYLK